MDHSLAKSINSIKQTRETNKIRNILLYTIQNFYCNLLVIDIIEQ